MVSHHGPRHGRALEDELKGIALFVNNANQAIDTLQARLSCCQAGIERLVLRNRRNHGIAGLAGKASGNGSKRKHEFFHITPFATHQYATHSVTCQQVKSRAGSLMNGERLLAIRPFFRDVAAMSGFDASGRNAAISEREQPA